jgi:hypothetical protein
MARALPALKPSRVVPLVPPAAEPAAFEAVFN